ncbi:MAG: hypothetical protein K0R17_3751 [Rariglobus sp.]|jgi:hypothetical protein|nr:hypothetical protein [Rariglobus sp.]
MRLPPRDHSHIELTYITHFYCNKPGSFEHVRSLLEAYASYPAEILDRMHFVLVDDGSPVPYEIPDFNLNLTWLRITEDIPWNNPGARNLGVTYAKSDKVVLTDLDHQFPAETFRHIVERGECGRNFYKIYRTGDDGKIMRSHPNLFLMSRARFMRLWGYDEHFCGHYAHDDMWFVKFQKWHGSRQCHLPKKVRVFIRLKEARTFTHSLQRDLSTNEKIYEEKRAAIENFGRNQGHTRRFLDFKWNVELERARPTVPPLKKNRAWKLLWWFRLLLPSP